MKNFVIFVAILSLITLGTYLYTNYEPDQKLEYPMELAGVTWPIGTVYETDVDDNIILTLEKELKALRGIWPVGTKFYFEGNKVYGIEVFEDFEFADFNFFQGAKIAFQYRDEIKHIIELSDKKEIDGLPLKEGCLIKFSNYVLESASCPEYQDVYFKRRLALPKVENEKGE